MELLIVSSEDPSVEQYNWDIDVEDGIAKTVPEGAEDDQEANIVAYLEKTTIPLMEERGIDWVGYLNKRNSLAEIDSQIRNNIKDYLETVLYSPVYTAQKGRLEVHLAKIVINTGA